MMTPQDPKQRDNQPPTSKGQLQPSALPSSAAMSLINPTQLLSGGHAAQLMGPGRLQLLLDYCLQATSEGPDGYHAGSSAIHTSSTGSSRQLVNPIAGGGHGCHLASSQTAAPAPAGVPSTSKQQHQQQQQQQPFLKKILQPWELPDFIPADLAQSVVPEIRRRQGVDVMPPVITAGGARPDSVWQQLTPTTRQRLWQQLHNAVSCSLKLNH
jgi:hypothetical protein